MRSCPPDVVRPKLRDVLAGPVLPRDEDENTNHARNILFELNLGAKLFEGGAAPMLGERPDLSCMRQDKKLLLECKRVLTKRGAQKRLKKARRDLTDLLKAERVGARGVIALSLTKLVNPGDAIFSFSDESAAREGLGAVLSEKADSLRRSWEHPGTKIIGVIFHVITPTFLENQKLLALQQRTHVVSLAPNGSSDERTLRDLKDCLAMVWY